MYDIGTANPVQVIMIVGGRFITDEEIVPTESSPQTEGTIKSVNAA